ncbi:MAG: hypothetical protein HOY79_17820 [Streptomyces sp.]|nr:hypothetical protein [Streptomyces sp.]
MALPRKDPNWMSVKRSKNCTCCGGHLVREQRRVGIPDDPDYAVAVCPVCDVAPAQERP